MKLSPIPTNNTLKEQIYEMLRAAIIDMNIYDEDANLRLDERSLSEQLGISRTPLREALSRLEQEGFLEVRPRKGVFVLRKTMDDVLDMIVAWAALESMAARLSVTNATDKQIAALRKHAMSHSASSARADLSEYSDANIRFHQMIFEMCGSAQLKDMAERLFVHMYAVRRRALAENDRAANSVVDHMGIIEALETREADVAARLSREHTMRLHEHVRRAWTKLDARAAGEKNA
ncbi:GntR family transcriptional regulator [Algicella marina]|uniref:FCD domain-containing protein n=1 Tax=Algicella marina TaxID=2683284 RepID=A0A6P1SXD0_9RHOB|nr:GntR family transcriptional regulator [Algicella marina]QHQ34195.1 FCD domain-containing protein [Algicella marina]